MTQGSELWLTAMANIRAMAADRDNWEDSLKGNILLSLETQAESVFTVRSVLLTHPALFLSLVHTLPEREQDILLMSRLLGKTQEQIGQIVNRSQTMVSWLCRRAEHAMAATLFSEPEAALLEIALETDDVEAACILESYFETVSCKETGLELSRTTGTVRRTIKAFVLSLAAAADQKKQCLSAWLDLLLETNDWNELPSKIERRNLEKRELKRTDPECLGQFYIPMETTDFNALFTSRGTDNEDISEEETN